MSHSGHYEYQIMPFGLSNLPSVFQRFINEVLRELIQRFVIVYINDILIYSRTPVELRQHFKQVLQRLREHHLYLKLEKCEFHTTSVQFLGYVIDQQGIQMDQRKVKTIQNWPQPISVKDSWDSQISIATSSRIIVSSVHLSPHSSRTVPSLCPGTRLPPMPLQTSKKP